MTHPTKIPGIQPLPRRLGTRRNLDRRFAGRADSRTRFALHPLGVGGESLPCEVVGFATLQELSDRLQMIAEILQVPPVNSRARERSSAASGTSHAAVRGSQIISGRKRLARFARRQKTPGRPRSRSELPRRRRDG